MIIVQKRYQKLIEIFKLRYNIKKRFECIIIIKKHKMLSCFSKKKEAPQVNNNTKFKKPCYCFKSAASGKVLDMSQADEQLVIWDRNGNDNQMFSIKQKGPDFYIKCKKNKLYLTVDGPQNGARVYGTSKNMGENQRFRI
jgi:hypothetical protein